MLVKLKLSLVSLITFWVLVLGVVVLFTLWTANLILMTNDYFSSLDGYVSLPKPITPNEVDQSESAYVADAEDRDHRKMSVAIYLLSDKYKWKLGSYEKLNDAYEKIPISNEMIKLIRSAEEVICAGASSQEFVGALASNEGRRIEENRAAERARTIARWIDELGTGVSVRKWNIGQWMNRSFEVDTSAQRRVIIILVLKKTYGINLDEALRNALEREMSRIKRTRLF